MRRIILLLLLLAGGCALFKPKPPPVTLRFHEQADASLPESRVRVAYVPGTQQQIIVDPFAQLTERDVVEARLVPAPGGAAVLLKFDLHGANLLSEMTIRMRGRYVVVFVDEEPVAAVLVDQRITNGEFLLEADMTEEKERALVNDLNKIAGKKQDFGDTQFKP
jgi:preprotein translocase subunit SecD